MPPYCPSSSVMPTLAPIRLVLVPIKCFYCNHTEDIYEWLICQHFGILHCSEHDEAAKRDCENFMHNEGWVWLGDARAHNTLGPFLKALGNQIPVLRSSGAVDTNWFFTTIQDVPAIKYSKSTNKWGFNLTNGYADKFVPLTDFRDPRISPLVKEEVRDMLETVASALTTGIYCA